MKYLTIILALLVFTNVHAGWLDIAESLISKDEKQEVSSVDSVQSDALRAALKQGVGFAVQTLGKKDGYLNDEKAKVNLPESVQKMESVIRSSGGDKILDDLVLSMNNAATQAAPKTADIFYTTIKNMTISDTQKILNSDDNALTQYFKEHSNADLEKEIQPIVKEMMDKNQVNTYYKQVRAYYEKYGSAIPYKDTLLSAGKSFGLDAYAPPENLETYVTQKAIVGLFIKIAQEEKKIRENPLVQKTKVIRDVFGSL